MDDSTAQVHVRKYFDDFDSDDLLKEQVTDWSTKWGVGTYVKVVGGIRRVSNQVFFVSALHINAIADVNDLLHCHAEVYRLQKTMERAAAASAAGGTGGGVSGGVPGAGLPGGFGAAGQGGGQGGAFGGLGGAMAGAGAASAPVAANGGGPAGNQGGGAEEVQNPLKKRILDILKMPHVDERVGRPENLLACGERVGVVDIILKIGRMWTSGCPENLLACEGAGRCSRYPQNRSHVDGRVGLKIC